MAGPWLYAISSRAKRTFDLEGRSVPVTTKSYRELVDNGRITEDRYWSIAQLWREVENGDELFVYSGDEDLGIIGYGIVTDLKERKGGWVLLPSFDLAKCRSLLECPIPAPVVRGWIPLPRRNVIDLAPFKARLYPRLPWFKSRHRRRSAPRTG